MDGSNNYWDEWIKQSMVQAVTHGWFRQSLMTHQTVHVTHGWFRQSDSWMVQAVWLMDGSGCLTHGWFRQSDLWMVQAVWLMDGSRSHSWMVQAVWRMDGSASLTHGWFKQSLMDGSSSHWWVVQAVTDGWFKQSLMDGSSSHSWMVQAITDEWFKQSLMGRVVQRGQDYGHHTTSYLSYHVVAIRIKGTILCCSCQEDNIMHMCIECNCQNERQQDSWAINFSNHEVSVQSEFTLQSIKIYFIPFCL